MGLKIYIFLNSCLGYADKIGCVDYKIAKIVNCSRKLPQNVEYCFFMYSTIVLQIVLEAWVTTNNIFADTAFNPL
jgi:hypothetical protein